VSGEQTIGDRLYEQAGRESGIREQDLKRNPWFTCLRCGVRFHFREHHWCDR
jgi:hypothetical protein